MTEQEKYKLIKDFINYDKVNDKVKTKTELLELLKKYKGILSSSMIEYLNSLIELEFSVIRNEISETDREALSELAMYNQISIYNIYYRALNILKKENEQYYISSERGLYCSYKLNNHSITLFKFNYSTIKPTMNKINLYQTLEGATQRKAELDMVIEKLDKLYNEKNPYYMEPGVYGGFGTNWILHHEDQIRYYEQKFEELDKKRELSNEDKKEIAITNHIHKLLLDDYGLTKDDFKDESSENSISNIFDDTLDSQLEKVLTKKLPNLEIIDNIKYI